MKTEYLEPVIPVRLTEGQICHLRVLLSDPTIMGHFRGRLKADLQDIGKVIENEHMKWRAAYAS